MNYHQDCVVFCISHLISSLFEVVLNDKKSYNYFIFSIKANYHDSKSV